MRRILWCRQWTAAGWKLPPCPQKSTSLSMKSAVNVGFCCHFHLNRQTLLSLQLAQSNSFKLSTSQQQVEVANIFIHSLARIHKETFQENSGPLNPGSEEGEDWLSEDRSGNKQIKTDSSDSLYINRSLDSDYLHAWWNWWWLWNAHLKYKSVINNVLYLYVFFKIQNNINMYFIYFIHFRTIWMLLTDRLGRRKKNI